MEREKHQVALTELLAQAESKGYILFDDVMATAENFSLPLPDFDWLTEAITSRGILIYDEAPNMPSSDDDDEDDSEQRVEVVGNRLDEELDARDTGIKIGRRGRHGRSP